MANCAFKFLLIAATLFAGTGPTTTIKAESQSSKLVEACTKAAKTDNLIDFCAETFLKDKAAEFTDTNDWPKMSRVVITQGAAKAAAIQKTVADMADNKSRTYYERAMLNLCLQNVKSGAQQISDAASAFAKMEKISEHDLRDVQILVDNGKSNQGKCEDLLESQVTLADVKHQVHDAFLASRIVTRFLSRIEINVANISA